MQEIAVRPDRKMSTVRLHSTASPRRFAAANDNRNPNRRLPAIRRMIGAALDQPALFGLYFLLLGTFSTVGYVICGALALRFLR